MPPPPLVVIGAGLAGLATGCYARLNGYTTRIFEHHSQPGGVVAAWRRGDYLIDGGIHFLIGYRPGQPIYELYRELGIAPTLRAVPMETYVSFLDERSGRALAVTADLDRLEADLKQASPAASAVIAEILEGARRFATHGLGALEMGRPAELTGPLDRLRSFWAMRHVLRYFSGWYALPVSDYVQRRTGDPWLRWVLPNLFLPEVPLWFILMLLGEMAAGDLALPEGGSRELVELLERRYRDLGGEVHYNATVAEILVEGERAVGVRLADGTIHRATAVVSAADGRATLFGMLGGRYLDDQLNMRYQHWPRFRPLVMINFGVRRRFTGEPWLRVLRLARPLRVAGRDVEDLTVRLFNYSDRFAPPGSTVVQASFETKWTFWNDLQAEDRARYDAEKERVAAEVLSRLEPHYPGIGAAVEVTDVATPYTTWRYTLNDRGAFEGWLPTPEALMATMPRTLPGLEGFAMAGQWVVPGGGVPPCLYSGRHAVEILCRRDRRPFR